MGKVFLVVTNWNNAMLVESESLLSKLHILNNSIIEQQIDADSEGKLDLPVNISLFQIIGNTTQEHTTQRSVHYSVVV